MNNMTKKKRQKKTFNLLHYFIYMTQDKVYTTCGCIVQKVVSRKEAD